MPNIRLPPDNYCSMHRMKVLSIMGHLHDDVVQMDAALRLYVAYYILNVEIVRQA